MKQKRPEARPDLQVIKFYYKIGDGSIFLGEFGGGEEFCNKHSIPGKEIFPPPHVFQVPVSFPLCSSWIIKDHLEEPMKSHSTFGLFTAIFSPLSNRGEAPTFQRLIHSLQSCSKVSQGTGDGGTFICHECHVAPSAPLPISPDFSPKIAALSTDANPELSALSIEK